VGWIVRRGLEFVRKNLNPIWDLQQKGELEKLQNILIELRQTECLQNKNKISNTQNFQAIWCKLLRVSTVKQICGVLCAHVQIVQAIRSKKKLRVNKE
jgi:hypothetical protein